MTELTFDAAPGMVFADSESRVIRGVAIPLGAVGRTGGRAFRFLRDSVRFGDRTPLLAYHDTSKPVGRLTRSEWTDRGLECEFQVSRTPAGDEVLTLAADSVLGLSVGVDIDPANTHLSDGVLEVRLADGREVSCVPVPAFAGAAIDHVALHDERTVAPVTEENPPTVADQPVTVQLDAGQLGDAIANALAQRPAAQPVPLPRVSVEEPPPYRFDGTQGRFGFLADMIASHNGDTTARTRLETFMAEAFSPTRAGGSSAITTTNVGPLTPGGNRPDLWQGRLDYSRPLAGLVSTGTIDSRQPFTVPKLQDVGTLVSDHVEMVEPTPGTISATSLTVQPSPMSGLAVISREVYDDPGQPAADQIVWNAMVQQYGEALEHKIAAALDAVAGTPVTVSGSNAALVDGVTDVLAGMAFRRGGNRLSAFALNEALYGALIGARDTTGRRLLPVVAPSNADGSVSSGFGSLALGNLAGIPAWGLGAHSYVFNPGSVYAWYSAPRRLTFEFEVRAVRIGVWGYAGVAVLRDSDVVRVDYASA